VQDELCIVRGGGDVATGAVWRLHSSGFRVVVTELANPLTIRRAVAFSSAVGSGSFAVEGLTGRLVNDESDIAAITHGGDVAVMVCPGLPDLTYSVVVDARLAKRPLDSTTIPGVCVVGLGPGFVVGEHCDAVVETNRGHHLGRVLWEGSAQANTGTPGVIGGRGGDRVVRAPISGHVSWRCQIGTSVAVGDVLGFVESEALLAPFDGVVRGAIRDGQRVEANMKIGDIDPRGERSSCFEISDKALAVGGGVVEAVHTWLRSR
jgi:xanthine dehydrogenase accessory factor